MSNPTPETTPPKQRHGLIWLLPGILLGAVLLLLLHRCAPETPPPATGEENARRDEHAALLREKAFWQELLHKTPCEVKDALNLKLPSQTQDQHAARPDASTPQPIPPSDVPPNPQSLAPKEPQGTEAPASLTSPTSSASPSNPTAPAALTALQRVERGTALVLVFVPGGLRQGTGFFVNGDHLVTNRHVVQDAANNEALVIGGGLGGARKGRIVATAEGTDFDFAAIRITPAPDDHPLALPLTSVVNKTEKISAWGFPALVSEQDPAYTRLLEGDLGAVPEVVYTDGVVNAILDTKPRNIVHSAVVSSGSSGGPLVNDKGVVIGINTFIRLDADSNRQTQTALGGDAVMAFLKQHGIAFTEQPR